MDRETVNTGVGVGGKWVNKHTEEEERVQLSWVKPDSCLAEVIHRLCKGGGVEGVGRLRRGEEEFPFFTLGRSPPLLPAVLPFSDLS